MNNLQTKLKHRLLDLGITQKELADKMGVHKQVIANWLNGSRNPKRENIKKLCEILDLPMSFFYEEIDTSTVQPLNDITTMKLPILTTVVCGKPDYCTIDEQVIDDFAEVPKKLFPDSDFIVRCIGESMLPEIPPQAYCIIKKIDVPLNNKNMLVKTENGYTIKRIKVLDGKIELHFLNPSGKKITPKEIKIIGKVVGTYNIF
ncbi:MAG: helix-turn-helix domain-containing protein [Methanobrevibacter sp.]|nr:helix-turn-helix domain-containing protein [Clostridia bacterium]MBO7716238.1 helix-turn-helix domain-containing protein [Methanobrevibacter sp.]